MAEKQKLYCYADETGQHTQGKLFLVAVVITTSKLKDNIERRLEELERESGKDVLKWKLTSVERKKAYLQQILKIDALRGNLFYAVYRDTRNYLPLVASTIAKSIIAVSGGRDYQATIYIDGLRFAEIKKVVAELRKYKIRRRKVKGLRDESSAYIRLADALAGFFREHKEGDYYTQELFRQFQAKQFVVELS